MSTLPDYLTFYPKRQSLLLAIGAAARSKRSDSLLLVHRRPFFLGNSLPAGRVAGRDWWTLSELLDCMRQAYCATLTAEFDHLQHQYAASGVSAFPCTP